VTDPTLAPTTNLPGPLPQNAQLVTLAVPMFVLKARYTSPLDDKDKPLPPHRWSAVGSKGGPPTQHVGTQSDADGVSTIGGDKDFGDAKMNWHLYWQPVFTDPADLADWSKTGEAWIDLDKNQWVAPSKLQPLEKRRLIRVPLWTTPLKAKSGGFNDSPNDDFTKKGILKGDEVVKKLKANATFGTKDKPWTFLVDHQWMRSFVHFRFYNFKKKDFDVVPPGLVVRAKKTANKTAGGGTAIDTKGTIFVLHDQTKDDAKKNVDYAFETPASFTFVDLDAAAPPGPPPGKDDRVVTAAALPEGVKKRYPLPASWHSKGWEAFLDDGNAPSRKAFADLRGEDTAKDKPLAFHLDDFVLFDHKTNKPAPLPKDSRVAIFDHRLRFKGPFDPVIVHLFKDPLKGAYFRAEERFVKKDDELVDATFVVNHEDDFFVIRDGRVPGAPGTASFVGAKAAVARAPENPIGNFLNGYPNLDNNGTVILHFLPDAYEGPYTEADEGKFLKDHPKAKISHLLVYVPMKIAPAPVGPAQEDAPTAADAIPAAQMNPVYQALVDAATRWDQAHPAGGAANKKDYVIVPTAGVKDGTRVVKMRHYFGARTQGHPAFTILGAYKNGFLQGDRSFVAGKTMSLVATPKAAPAWTSGATGQDSDGFAFDEFVLAHELGHVMALPDEYGELIDIPAQTPPAPNPDTTADPRIIRFDQRDAGYPAYADLDGLMRYLRLTRLRYVWHHVQAFLNNGGAKAQLPEGPYALSAPAFHGGITFVMPEGDKTHPWQSIAGGAGPGHTHLNLYHAGDDEANVERVFPRPAANKNAPGEWMQGVVVVTSRIWFNFLASKGGKFANHNARWQVMFNFHKLLFSAQMVPQQKFFVQGDPSLRLPRIGVLFQPRMEFGPVPQPFGGGKASEANADIVVDVVFQSGAPQPVVHPHNWPHSHKPRLEINVGDAQLAILRFALGIAPNPAPVNTPITAAELQPLATAVQKLLGDKKGDPPRQVKDLPP
jgi:hypothetical protein